MKCWNPTYRGKLAIDLAHEQNTEFREVFCLRMKRSRSSQSVSQLVGHEILTEMIETIEKIYSPQASL